MYGRAHLMLAVPIYILAVRYLSDYATVLLSPFLALFCLLTMAGSLFPDVDWAVTRYIHEFGHRNPLTHSLLIPVALYLPIWYYALSNPTLIACYDAFTLGVAAHLLGDVVKTGNLVWIKSRKHENEWYLANGLTLVALLYFTNFFTALRF